MSTPKEIRLARLLRWREDKLAKSHRVTDLPSRYDLQLLSAVVDFAERAQEQNRRLVPFLAHPAHHRQTVDPRHHAVDDGDIVVAAHGEMQPIFTVAGVVDDVAALLQAAREIGGGFAVVFNNKNSHIARVLFSSRDGDVWGQRSRPQALVGRSGQFLSLTGT